MTPATEALAEPAVSLALPVEQAGAAACWAVSREPVARRVLVVRVARAAMPAPLVPAAREAALTADRLSRQAPTATQVPKARTAHPANRHWALQAWSPGLEVAVN
ncbi:hypothetical protein [Mycobacterium szulgai]|uniref:hypothetical protein n=1 Tax=Mycobacterium szulgai TaxID=1787 RepID=UPI0021F29050|nr:hypothetical protein [Mycobacterium szulgai]MCV7078548.1 hypothetical protein [Mycobacterium szulgai]